MSKDCACVWGRLLIFSRSDIQYVGVYFCIRDSDDLKTGWKPNLKQELSSVHMYAHVLSSKLRRHHYPSITTVHSEGTPTAFDLQPHIHTSLRAGLVLKRLYSQLSEWAMFLAQPIQNQLAVESNQRLKVTLAPHCQLKKTLHVTPKVKSVFLPPSILVSSLPPTETGQYALRWWQKLLYMCVWLSVSIPKRGAGSVKDLIQVTAVASLN